ncbi:MAG: HU family DNA-binding protein [Balneolaceae bacterium]|nr:HU family DNA-binding protein [Balneolaceae bacterium]
MNTRDVVEALAESRDLSKAETRRLLDTAVETLKRNLSEGRGYSIPELGTFETHTRDARRSYNPHHESYMRLPPKRVVRFSPSKGLKEEMKELEETS